MEENRPNLLKTFVNPIFKENPILVMLLGLCPVLVVTDTFDKALGMGVAVILVLFFTNLVISLIRKIVPNEIRIPVFIVIIACFVTMVDRLMEAFTPTLYSSLGVVISMITVNCIVLGRGEAFASKNKVLPSIIDGLGTGVGFLVACVIIGLLREFLGKGGLTLTNPFTSEIIFSSYPLADYAVSLFTSKSGAFLTLGLVVGISSFIKIKSEEKKALKEKAKLAKEAK